ncbi:MAG: DUF5343 domain-containing protein [Acidobacteriota bacterium]|nr:DUF5343 domain-containing protein [Acidobacteriota bacterium]
MDVEVPYMPSVSNLTRILDAIQKAGAPDAFGLDFLKDLGFTSSNDRAAIKLFKYLGLLDTSGKPQTSYREFMDSNKAKGVLATRIRSAYRDLFLSDKNANTQSVEKLKGWFKTKTGAGDAVAKKMATTFKALSSYADFSQAQANKSMEAEKEEPIPTKEPESAAGRKEKGSAPPVVGGAVSGLNLGFTYRIEIHLPDTTNVETYRSIFKAIREELGD